MRQVSNRGFTIVELVIAIVVGGVIFATAGVAISNYSHLSGRGQNLVLANSFAEGKVESLRSISYSGLSTGTTDISGELPAGLQAPKSASLEISEPTQGLNHL